MASKGRSGRWSAGDAPSQSGRTVVVTGASGGLGLETARVLAGLGAAVILACRDMDKAGRAVAAIQAAAPLASVRAVHLELHRLASVREAADEIRESCPRLDLLINNAAVMTPPYQRTEDGFELTFATNHLGHFALTGLLLGPLLAVPGSRVVTVSSVAHTRGQMDLDDAHRSGRGYDAGQAYGDSKLANLLFTYELQARLEAAGTFTSALAAHPGVVRTELWRTSPLLERVVISPWLRMLNFRVVHSAQLGALPTLRAATDRSASGGQYYGPARKSGYTGHPVPVQPHPRALDQDSQHRLWEISEELTGVSYDLGTVSSRPPGRIPLR